MDSTLISTIASTTISLLTPYLKSLGDEFIKGIGNEAGAKTTDLLFDKSQNLYDLVKRQFRQEKTTSDLIDSFEKKPTDPKLQSAVEYHLSQYLLNNPNLLQELSRAAAELEQIRSKQINVNMENVNGSLIQTGSFSGGTMIGQAIFVSNSDPSRTLERLQEIMSPGKDGSYTAKNRKNLIEIGVKSKRFKKHFKLIVEKDMLISELADVIINKLSLPRERKVLPELRMRVDFSYQISYHDNPVPNSKLSALGIVDGEIVELVITTMWTDEIQEREYEEAAQGAIQYESKQIEELIRRDIAKRTRGRITQALIDSLANATFAYIEDLEI